MRVGVIGTGLIADFAHLPAYRQLGAEIVAVADVVESRAQTMAHKYGVSQAYGDYRRLLERTDIEAVSITVPNYLHAAMTVEALAAGKHVLVEKPMAMNVAEAERMQEAAQRAHRTLMVGFSSRFRPDVQKLKRLVVAGDLGDLYFASTGYLRRRGYPKGWFTVAAESGGGPVVDIGIHVLDMARYLAGGPEPISVVAETSQKFGACPVEDGVWESSDVREGLRDGSAFDVEDFATAWIRFEGGLVVTLETAWTANVGHDRVYVNLLGTRAGAVIDSYHPIHKQGQDSPKTSDGLDVYGEIEGMVADSWIGCRSGTPHTEEIRHFMAVVEGREAPQMTAQDGVVMQRILASIYQSARDHQEVSLAPSIRVANG